MKSNNKIVTVATVVGLLLVGGVLASLFMKDSKTAQWVTPSPTNQQAKIVRAYVVNFCMEYARYPSKKEFAKRYPKLASNPDWSYTPGKDLKSGSLQYPTPLFSAVGNSNTVTNPCQVFNTEVF